jgi:glycosidase
MAVFQLSWPGAPMIYYGTETGMWGADDPDDRKPMIWSDLQYEAEKNHPYGWERGVDSVGFNADLFEHYSGLVQLRMNSEALRKGELSVIETDNPKVLAYERITQKDTVLVIINHQDSVFWMESKLWNQVSAKYVTVFTSQGKKTDPRDTQHVQNYEVRSNGLVIREKKRGISPYSYVIYRAHR